MKKKMIALTLKKKRIANLNFLYGGNEETNVESQCANAPCTGDTNITGACDSDLQSCFKTCNTTSVADTLSDSDSIFTNCGLGG
jgi:hypothetical protein